MILLGAAGAQELMLPGRPRRVAQRKAEQNTSKQRCAVVKPDAAHANTAHV